MANLIRSAKSGNDWTENELAAYNIHIQEQSLQDFFGVATVKALPDAQASLTILGFSTTKDRNNAPDDNTYRLLHFLDLAHMPKVGQEAAVDLFAEKLLNQLGYAQGRRIIMIRQALPFFNCGSNCSAQTDVCVLDSNDILLLVQKDKQFDNNADSEPQVIAEAIAAFQRNNYTRERKLHLPVLHQMVIPAMTMHGTFPTFYKITVTAALNDAVKTGTFPVAATAVYRHIPRLPRRISDGMKNLANRSILLRYLEAFKQFV
ncbi:hypothetical protein C8F04DRAFT_476747 [Mycena alexandri]|uniref:Uncharacterized protein n=1 Tax=Mycena alexandri TaxID=1745969 RepID=A0AAD6RXP0_9AGAR|nr:hypothetical protein C8F04DRAFT_476747 [Mycena alexandri]